MAVLDVFTHLDYKSVDLHAFAAYFGDRNLNIFAPISDIECTDYKEFVKYFPDSVRLSSLLNDEICNYIRIQVLKANGYLTDRHGYYYSRNNIANPYKFWI